MIQTASNPVGSEETQCPQCPQCPASQECPTSPECPVCQECPECQGEVGNQETEAICPATALPSNSSLVDFYDKVMTHNNSVVDLVCCKLDKTPVFVSCGQGLSCAAACYAEQAVLCPSHDCEDCENVDDEEEVEE